MLGRLLTVYVRLAGLPSLPPPVERPGFAEAADALMRGEDVEIPEPRLDFFRWLGANREVAFHGSLHGEIAELSTERKSRDATAWGDQTAVYATTDPVWALYFATLRRDNGWTGTRNGTMDIGDGRRRYFFVHNRGSASPERFGPGTLYVLPLDTFEAEPPLAGTIDTAHLVSRVPVQPLGRVAVTPEDFPFRDRIAYFRDREPIWITLLRA